MIKGRKMRKRNGFTIVEVVIAMTVIIIVSITAISFVAQSSNIANGNISQVEAKLFADSALECFKFAGNEEEYVAAMSEVLGSVVSGGDSGGGSGGGSGTVVCSKCGNAYVPGKSHTHNIKWIPKQEAGSCAEDSVDGYFFCAGCGKCFDNVNGQKELTYNGLVTHGNHTMPAKLGCESEVKCERCGYVMYSAPGHKFVNGVCIVCDDNRGSDVGHVHTPGSAATCENDQICTVCGTVLEEAGTHDYVSGKCTVCGQSEPSESTYTTSTNNNYVPALNQTYNFNLSTDYALEGVNATVTRDQVEAVASDPQAANAAGNIGAYMSHGMILDSNSTNDKMSYLSSKAVTGKTLNETGTVIGDVPYVVYKVKAESGKIIDTITVRLNVGNMHENRIAIFVTDKLYYDANKGCMNFDKFTKVGFYEGKNYENHYIESKTMDYIFSTGAAMNKDELYVVIAFCNYSTDETDSKRLCESSYSNYARITAIRIETQTTTSLSHVCSINTLVYIPEVAATCDYDGHGAYFSCSCGKLYSKPSANAADEISVSKILPATGHTYTTTYSFNETEHWKYCTKCRRREPNTAGEHTNTATPGVVIGGNHYSVSKNGYTATIDASYETGVFSAVVTSDHENDKIVYTLDYERGVG